MAELGRSFIIGAENTEEEIKQMSGSNSNVGRIHVFSGQKKWREKNPVLLLERQTDMFTVLTFCT